MADPIFHGNSLYPPTSKERIPAAKAETWTALLAGPDRRELHVRIVMEGRGFFAVGKGHALHKDVVPDWTAAPDQELLLVKPHGHRLFYKAPGNKNAGLAVGYAADNTLSALGGITVALSSDTVKKGKKTTLSVVLDSEPAGDVEVTLTYDGSVASMLTGASGDKTFTAKNWDTAQTYDITGAKVGQATLAVKVKTTASVNYDKSVEATILVTVHA